ncbi:MAG: hypothetical protein ACOY94_26445 [Bacillota bacterium]
MRVWMALILVTTMLLTACGAGSSGSTAPNPGTAKTESGAATDPPVTTTKQADTEDEGSDTQQASGGEQQGVSLDLDLEGLETPRDLKGILDRFSLLAYEYISPEATVTITIRAAGSEMVDGVAADRVAIEMTDTSTGDERMELWIGPDGETLKMVQDGEELPAQVVGMMGSAMLMSLLWPFMTADQMDLAAALEEGSSASPFHVAKASRETKQFGQVPAEVTIMEVTVAGGNATGGYTWEVANFGEFLMFTRWQIAVSGSDGAETSEFRVVEVGLR